ncbi:hypothetical protein RPC_4259 [Rhodopseudomonas palustris BisB18]|uniref:Uncharacterized protein n=1 Tax=Rhodopseudomonas palustris (strain BisB18) TaxID=316056 RepID=Q20YK3_RHOPB
MPQAEPIARRSHRRGNLPSTCDDLALAAAGDGRANAAALGHSSLDHRYENREPRRLLARRNSPCVAARVMLFSGRLRCLW